MEAKKKESTTSKRKRMQKLKWIKNVMRIQGLTKEEAEQLHDKFYK